jgi:RNA 2',3'-cyclic 3'-phosphodiesterase
VIRLFCAIAIPEDVRHGLERRQQGLPGARWRPTDTLHVTLRFFGEVAETLADDLNAELSVTGGRAFDLALAGVGVFGDGQETRAVWAGVEDNESLRRLAGRCETAARRAGLKAERRPWRPHVTLAYLRNPEPSRVAAWVQGHNLLRSPPFRVDAFGLYSSWRTDFGSHYRLERDYPLEQPSIRL